MLSLHDSKYAHGYRNYMRSPDTSTELVFDDTHQYSLASICDQYLECPW
jgi:hypothetical protein